MKIAGFSGPIPQHSHPIQGHQQRGTHIGQNGHPHRAPAKHHENEEDAFYPDTEGNVGEDGAHGGLAELEKKGQLAQIIIQGPDPEIDGISAYTLEDLAGIANERWNVTYHPWSMSRVIKRLSFSRQKARPAHPKTNEAAQAAFKGASQTVA